MSVGGLLVTGEVIIAPVTVPNVKACPNSSASSFTLNARSDVPEVKPAVD